MMNRFTVFFLLSVVCFNISGQKKYKFPNTPKDSIHYIIKSDTIFDGYQWMEDYNDPRLQDWIEEQQKFTTKYKKKYVNSWNLRSQIATMYHGVREKQLDNFQERADSLKSKYEFDYKVTNSKRTMDLVYRRRGKKNYKRLVHIKDFRESKNDNIAVSGYYVNEEEDLIAVALSKNGSDWKTAYVFDLLTGEQLPEKIENIRGSILWHGKSLIYDAYDRPANSDQALEKAKGQKLFLHKLGDDLEQDVMIYRNPDTSGTTSVSWQKIKNNLFLHHYLRLKGKTYRALSYADLEIEKFNWFNFLIYPNSADISLHLESVFDNDVILRTNWDAPNERVLKAKMTKRNELVEVIPEYDILLKQVNRLGKDKFACLYTNNGADIAMIFNLNGELLRKISFPDGKKVRYFYETKENASHTLFSVSSFYHPDIWYQLSLEDLTFKPVQEISVPYKPEDLETRFVNYEGKDGELIPMYITCLKSTKLDGNNPTLLYGYGGYGTTIEPNFDESITLFLLRGGVYAVPNIRGGGGKGSNWRDAGRRLNKQNAINDFISAAEYLINENYTSAKKLAINGASHGGMLVAAALTQRPELFKVAIAEAGVYDMLRFENYTVGSALTNLNEFGTVEDDEDYRNLKSYSPFHNINQGVEYPNTLLVTGSNDDRVPPHHTYKFLANLQEKGSNTGLYTLYVVNGSGHGGALTPEDWVQKTVYKYVFLYQHLGI